MPEIQAHLKILHHRPGYVCVVHNVKERRSAIICFLQEKKQKRKLQIEVLIAKGVFSHGTLVSVVDTPSTKQGKA